MLFNREQPKGIRGRREARAKAKRRAEMLDTAKATTRRVAPWVALTAAVAAIGRFAYARRATISRAVRQAPAKVRGMAYKVRRRPYAPDVSDDVLLGRARSIIAPLEAELGAAPLHLSTAHGLISVHGTVETRAIATMIERALAGVPGAHGVESHLQIAEPEEVPARGYKLGRIATSRERREEEYDQEIALD